MENEIGFLYDWSKLQILIERGLVQETSEPLRRQDRRIVGRTLRG